MIVELFVDDNYEGPYGNCALMARLTDGSVVVADSWYDDERSCHIKEWEYLSWHGKDIDELKAVVRERDVAHIRSWV